jgi:hypothetical protein
MPWESIGSVGTGQSLLDLEWVEFCQTLAIEFIRLTCGEPPLGSELGIMQNDHELGSYPTIGVWSEYSPEFDCIHKCEVALNLFDSAVEWKTLKDHFEQQTNLTDDEEDIVEDAD